MEPKNTNPKENQKRRPPCGPTGRHLLKTAGAILMVGLAFRLLWNWAGVPLFSFPPLTYLQAVSAVVTVGVIMMLCIRASRHHRRHKYHHAAFACCPAKPSGPDKNGIRDIIYKAMVS